MRKTLLIASSCLLLLAACHRGEKQAVPEETIPEVPVPVVVGDSLSLSDGDDNVGKRPRQYTLEEDSAEITQLRIFARKQRTIYSPALLLGEWKRGTEHEVYLADGTGMMWDSSDDVLRDEAQHFEWTLDSNMLTIICHLELGGVLPKRYVVTFADDENLAYSSRLGEAYLWDKVADAPNL